MYKKCTRIPTSFRNSNRDMARETKYGAQVQQEHMLRFAMHVDYVCSEVDDAYNKRGHCLQKKEH